MTRKLWQKVNFKWNGLGLTTRRAAVNGWDLNPWRRSPLSSGHMWEHNTHIMAPFWSGHLDSCRAINQPRLSVVPQVCSRSDVFLRSHTKKLQLSLIVIQTWSKALYVAGDCSKYQCRPNVHPLLALYCLYAKAHAQFFSMSLLNCCPLAQPFFVSVLSGCVWWAACLLLRTQ